MNERMTWEEITKKYPNQWVGLDDVEWDAPDGATVISAIVCYTGKTKSELTRMQIETKGKIIARHTDPNGILFSGMMY